MMLVPGQYPQKQGKKNYGLTFSEVSISIKDKTNVKNKVSRTFLFSSTKSGVYVSECTCLCGMHI